jgi:hypothetical protein
VVVELHRRYGRDPDTEHATPTILERARPFEWGGRTLNAASPSDLLSIACYHVFVGHSGERRFRPRHLADCAVLIANGAAAAAAALLAGAADAVTRSLEAVGSGDQGGILVTAASDAGLRMERLVSAARARPFSLFFPDRDYMARRYRVSRRSRLLPLLYLWRPVRGAWRVVTGR